uniref:Uncharacterized protein n=1 Tax=Trichuris muris TaxID=70415 RepID=A0A5S6QEU7_TRIMR
MCALEKHWNDKMIHSRKFFGMDKVNGSWSNIQAPMFADTFSWSAAGLSDSWLHCSAGGRTKGDRIKNAKPMTSSNISVVIPEDRA